MRRVPPWRRYDRMLGADRAADVAEELRFHLQSKIDYLLACGWNPAEARREAERQFGDVRAVQRVGERMGEQMERRRRMADYWTDCVRDVCYTLRSLRHNPSFTVVAIVVLALGVGVNVAVFSVVNTLLLRPLPFPDSQKLVWFTGGKSLDAKTRADGGLSGGTFTVSAYEEFKHHNQSFQAMTVFQPFYNSLQYKLTGWGEPRRLDVVEVADNFFPTLGVQAAMGRNFNEEECVKGGRPAAMLDYFFWKTHLAADPAIVGKTITINNAPVTVVGVLPASFDFGSVFAPGKKVDVFVPAVMDFWATWGNTFAMVGRLKPGVTLAQAQDEADRLFPLLKAEHRDWFEDYSSDLDTLKDHVEGKLSRSLVVLWSAVGMILLIACVNLSNLQLGRAMTRGKEFAMRRALGAGRERLMRQLLTESLMLSVAGSALGLALALGLVSYLAHQKAMTLPLLTTLHLDGSALAWTLLIAGSVGILFGLAPAVRMSGVHLLGTLKSGGTGMSAGRGHERFRSMLVITEVALACVLLVGAGLLLRSFLHVLQVDLGFEPARAWAMDIDLPPAGDNGQLIKRATLLKTEIERVSTLVSVQAAGITDMLPLGRNRSWGLQSVGRPHAKGADQIAFVYLITPGYLRAMGMRLVAGRDFSWDDTPDKQHVILVNEAAARREWPGENPVGKLAYATGKTPDLVVGVVADVRESTVEQAPSVQMYVPITQNADVEGPMLVVRSSGERVALGGSLLAALRSLNPLQPATELRPLQSLVDHSVSPRRFFAQLVGIFAGLGMLLAAVGIYGVVSYSVTQKTQEIGVRMALGATAWRVRREVLEQTLRMSLAGVVLGTAASLGAVRLIASLLFAMSPWDPLAFGGVAVGLIAVALVAGYVPARRASRIEPMAALRE